MAKVRDRARAALTPRIDQPGRIPRQQIVLVERVDARVQPRSPLGGRRLWGEEQQDRDESCEEQPPHGGQRNASAGVSSGNDEACSCGNRLRY